MTDSALAPWVIAPVILPAMALLVATCAATMIGHLGKARA